MSDKKGISLGEKAVFKSGDSKAVVIPDLVAKAMDVQLGKKQVEMFWNGKALTIEFNGKE